MCEKHPQVCQECLREEIAQKEKELQELKDKLVLRGDNINIYSPELCSPVWPLGDGRWYRII